MATQAALRRSLWSEERIHYEHGRSPVIYVYRHDGEREEPWTVIAQSAILKRLGINAWGLYAAKPMKEGDYVGQYDGTLVGHYTTRARLEMANDPRGTRLQTNMDMSEFGWFRVTRGHIPAFSLAKTVEENANAELRWDYTGDGGQYWEFHELLGTHDVPIECD